ncbi:histone-lysine N-methyltransferase SETMAR [Trichonephila clavipes]|nr:histone-lysine N-methyltransferase SETMAR [Trichonephila clavipes]
MEVNKEKIWYILQFFFHTSENASQAAEIVNGVYGADTAGPSSKISVIIEVDRHVSSRSIAQELKIDHETVLNHLRQVGFKKKLHVWGPHQLTPKNMMDSISICDKWNEIDPFLKHMVTRNEKWVTYYNIVRNRSWSKNSIEISSRIWQLISAPISRIGA